MPDGSLIRGCDGQDGLIAPDIALRLLLEDAAPVAREATVPAQASLGRVLAQKPGKPLAHGRLRGARCLFLPGNPVAALVGMLTLGLPLLHRLAGLPATALRLAPCVLAEGFARQPGRLEYVPVRARGETEDGLLLVERTGPAGSARLLPLATADGLLRIPAALDSVLAGGRFGMLPLQRLA
jgi:molybdopterin molybdotransferase